MTAEARPLGLALATLGVGTCVAALSIGGWGTNAWGPRTVPLLASLTLIAGGAAIAFSPSAAAPPSTVEGETSSDDPGGLRVAMLLGLAVLYVLGIDRIGYLVATALAAPLAFWLFGARRTLTLVLAATLLPLVLHLAFFRLLGVFPPLGSWFDLLDYLPL